MKILGGIMQQLFVQKVKICISSYEIDQDIKNHDYSLDKTSWFFYN